MKPKRCRDAGKMTKDKKEQVAEFLITSFLCFVIVLLMITCLIIGYDMDKKSMERQAVEHRVALYDGKTKEFKWKTLGQIIDTLSGGNP